MPTTQQEFLASNTEQAAKSVFAALLALPEDKRAWSANGARTALNMVAECALNNGYTADLVETRQWTAPPFEEYLALMNTVAGEDLGDLEKRLQESARRASAAIRNVPDDAMGVTFETPFGTMTMMQTIAYPYWNMSYHEGQINFIGSLK